MIQTVHYVNAEYGLTIRDLIIIGSKKEYRISL